MWLTPSTTKAWTQSTGRRYASDAGRALTYRRGARSPGSAEWLGFAYVTVISAFAGFFAWYAGLARGGIARTSQIQLAQPLLTFAWSALFLGETISLLTFVTGLAVLACVAITQRTRVVEAQPVSTG
ncbi:MAG TPA: DMT family transporter [Thermoleophilaceae bacterium]|nr:DMT family transporter [Thermoleophilaceae bacterium]